MAEEDVELVAALDALRESPLVRDVKPLYKGSRSKGIVNGYYATLWCSGQHPDRKSEQRQTTSTRDLLGCVTDLLEFINKNHGGHLEAAEAARAAAVVEAAAVAGPSAPTTAFAVMAAAARVQPAQEKAHAAELLAAEARGMLHGLELQLESANKAVEVAEAEASRLECEVRQRCSNCRSTALRRLLRFDPRVFAYVSLCYSPAPIRSRTPRANPRY